MDRQRLEINLDVIDTNSYEVPIKVEDDMKEDVGGVDQILKLKRRLTS